MISSYRVILPVKNESLRIEQVLSHYTQVCSLVTVIDNFSEDDTLQIIASKFPRVQTKCLVNQGTVETPSWWTSASSFFDTEYILLASCSEFISLELLNFFDLFSRAALADLLDIPRLSNTGGQSTDYLYFKPSSLFSQRIAYPTVTRLVRWAAIDPLRIHPHDSFRSQHGCSRLVLESTEVTFCIQHMRPSPSFQTAKKHLLYARQYAYTKCQGNPLIAIIDSLLRAFLDTSRILRSLVDRKCNRVIALEYLLRLLMHFQVVWFSFFPSQQS